MEISDKLISKDSKDFVASVSAESYLGGLFLKSEKGDAFEMKTEG